jgi:hypothetical protein
MDATHSVDGSDRAFDSGEHDAKPSGKFVRKIARFGEVLAGLEQNNDREPTRLRSTAEAPAFVRPQIFTIRGRAARAVDAIGAASLWIFFRGRSELAGAHLPGKRKGVPVVNGRHAK